MTVIGLTGSSGAGKSLVASILTKKGLPVIDADAIYHEILASGGACTDELVDAFGKEILDPRGLVDRHALASAVFGKPQTELLLHTLNDITHKYVMREIEKTLQTLQRNGTRFAVLDAPLLFEANADLLCDLVIGVVAREEAREARIVCRDGITTDEAQKRLRAQKSDEFYRSRCDHIIENDTDQATLEKNVFALLEKIGVKL